MCELCHHAAAMPPFDAVIFDNDGLLLDTEEAWTRAEETLFARRDRVWTMEHKRDLIGSSGPVAEAKLERMLDLPGEGVALMQELHDLVMEEVVQEVSPRPGALELLQRLGAAGVPLGLASNSRRPFVERVLAGAGLDGAASPFGVVVTASDVEHPKPAPDLYLAAAAALGVDPRRCAGLEDSPPGAASALAAGLFVIGVPYFPDGAMPDGIHLRAGSLADAAVHAALGV
ncbi:MAG: family phosphatase [Solirubrobacterales bacterium]|nr:family phosphatase [Solirubrobacterales bacterium]